MADEAVKERIRAASDIVEVIGRCFPLRKAGANYVALCPFHKEKTPSFQVSPSRQMFYCFGCRKGGDVFTFLQEYEKLTFPEALERLARRAGIALEHGGGGPRGRARGGKGCSPLHEELCAHWHLLLRERKEGEEGREYLRQRGLGPGCGRALPAGLRPRVPGTPPWSGGAAGDTSRFCWSRRGWRSAARTGRGSTTGSGEG